MVTSFVWSCTESNPRALSVLPKFSFLFLQPEGCVGGLLDELVSAFPFSYRHGDWMCTVMVFSWM